MDANKLVKSSLNLHYLDYHLGFKLEHDLNKMKSLFSIFALKNLKGDFFLKSDLLKQQFTLGCNHGHASGSRHSMELVYDHLRNVKGIQGSPVWANFAGEYDLSRDITLKTKVVAKNEVTIGCSWIHRFD